MRRCKKTYINSQLIYTTFVEETFTQNYEIFELNFTRLGEYVWNNKKKLINSFNLYEYFHPLICFPLKTYFSTDQDHISGQLTLDITLFIHPRKSLWKESMN